MSRKRTTTLARALSSAIMLLAALGSLACAGPKAAPGPQAPPSAKPAPAPLFRGQPSDYIPAAGLRWLVISRPAELLGNPGIRTALREVVPDSGLENYARSSGADPRRIPAAAVAGFDFATLYVGAVGDSDSLIEERFTKRLLSQKPRKRPHPDLWRVTGVVGQTPQTLVRIDRHLVAVSVGDPTPARVVEGFARRKLKKSPNALKGAALRTLPEELQRAPLSFYAPGPFTGEWMAGARGLLGHALAVGISMRPLPGAPGLARFTLYLSGDWAAVGPDSTARLMDAWDELSMSSTGALFGLNRLTSKPVVSGTAQLLKLEIDVELGRLLQGVHAAVAADVGELMQLEPRPVPEPTP